MPYFFEQLVAEWYEYRGYFVRRNIRVGKRQNGGHDFELDIVALHARDRHLVHVEATMDTNTWDRRRGKMERTFIAARHYIPSLFPGFSELPEPEHIALLGFGSNTKVQTIGLGRVQTLNELMADIRRSDIMEKYGKKAIPEQCVILRAMQFAATCWSVPRLG
jgi:hypothetical protein